MILQFFFYYEITKFLFQHLHHVRRSWLQTDKKMSGIYGLLIKPGEFNVTERGEFFFAKMM